MTIALNFNALRDVLSVKNRRTFEKRDRSIYGTIVIGNFNTNEELENALLEKGLSFDHTAGDAIKDIPLSKKKYKIELMRLNPMDLGLESAITLEKIYTAAKELYKFDILPAEAGAQVVLELPIARGEWLYIGMEPMVILNLDLKESGPCILKIGRRLDGTLCMYGRPFRLQSPPVVADEDFLFAKSITEVVEEE